MPEAKTAASRTRSDTREQPGPPFGPGAETDNVTADPIEASLAKAIGLACQAGQWGVVETLGRELGERRRARTAPTVASLEAERVRRELKR